MKKSIWAILFVCVLSMFPSCSVIAATQNVNARNAAAAGTDKNSKSLYNEKTDAIEVFNNDGKILTVSKNDVDLMAKVVYAESNSEPYEGKVAVASVILNRLRNNKFPKSIEGVIKQRYAFSCVVDGNVYANPDTTCYNAVFDALDGKDPTTSALYFYNPKTAHSSWMSSVKKYNIKNIGHHVFFITN